MDMDDEDEYDPREKLFHNTVREYIIFLLLFIALYVLSYAIIDRFRRKDRDDYFSTEEDEITVYKVSLYLCIFALSVSICAVLLLPFTIVSNEILLYYPKSYYVKWLNHSLIQGIWNLVFLFSNLSLFALLPFAYLFTESEGFTGYRRGVKSRVFETCIVLFLLTIVVFGLSYVISAIIDSSRFNIETIESFWAYFLPFLYSCMSFFGVVMLLICTPLGFIRLFGVVSRFLVKPQFLQNVNEEFYLVVMEENLLKRRLEHTTQTGDSYISPKPMTPNSCNKVEDIELFGLQNGALQSGLKEKLSKISQKRLLLQQQRATSMLQRNVVYPVAMLMLLIITVITVVLVLFNTLQILIGIKALPSSTTQFTVGLTSLSKLGLLGAGIEVVIIIYLAITSCVGLYTMPGISTIRPKSHKTPLSYLIANSALILILSSALPLLTRTLGITNFDLLGDFGKIEWLGNFHIIMLYNFSFAGVSTLCLVKKFTTPVFKELINRFKSILSIFISKDGHLKPPVFFPLTPTHASKEE